MIGIVAGLILAFILAYAAVAKWRTQPVTAASFADLGLPQPKLLARVVPGLELSVAVALVASPPIGGVAALVLLGSFTVFLAVRLQQGVTSGCACFGRADAPPLSKTELIRNAGLMALAAAALVG